MFKNVLSVYSTHLQNSGCVNGILFKKQKEDIKVILYICLLLNTNNPPELEGADFLNLSFWLCDG